jgi:release factor H-coupled RctB family protein
MGNFISQVANGITLIASNKLWLEDAAIGQLKTTAQLPGMQHVVGLPDLHPGRGYPVGAAFFSSGRFYPALVGNDIGCGMALWQTDILAAKAKPDKLDQQLGNLDHAIDEAEWAVLEQLEPALAAQRQALAAALTEAGVYAGIGAGIGARIDGAALNSLGTIGGGNHFIELQVVDQVLDPARFEAAGLQAKRLQVLVHTGSRGLGQQILRRHVDQFGHAGLEAGSSAAQQYLQQHACALQFARLNRRLVALRVLQRLRCSGALVLDVHHNFVAPQTIGNLVGWLHRKGASPSDAGLVMLPGSRGDYSYLLAPNEQAGEAALYSLYSLAHGAGRKWQRGDCKGRLFKLATPQQLTRTALGGRVICEDKALIYEEAPQAYKNVDSVVDCLTGAKLAQPVARNKPLISYKTRGECCA